MNIKQKVYVNADEMLPVRCDRESQETCIHWYREDDVMEICTSDITMVTKLKNIMRRDPENYKCYYHECNISEGTVGNYFFEVPKSLLTLRIGTTTKEENN